VWRQDNTVDVTPHDIVPEWFEFPRINYSRNGKEYNFAYGVRASEERGAGSALPEPDTVSNIINSTVLELLTLNLINMHFPTFLYFKITKVDVNTGKLTSWHAKGILASEPIFVPNNSLPHPAEDDGVILVALLHQDQLDKTTLLILDAKNMAEVGKVEFKTAGAATSTFHGQWATDGAKVHFN